jgi:hypothetical protein
MSAVTLRGEELEIARAEIEAVREIVHGGDYRTLLDELLERLDTETALDDGHVGELDRLLTLALQSGRVRALYGPGGEQAALRAFRKLPTGAELAGSAPAVNEALASLAGRTLERLTVTPVGPSGFTLSLAAGGTQLSIRLDRQGARVASVEA